MIEQKLVTCDVTDVHVGQRVVHEQVHVYLADSRRLTDGSIGLAKIAAPFREILARLLVLDQMARLAVGREEPRRRLLRIDCTTKTHSANHTSDHFAREWNVECPILAAFRLWNM